AQPIEFDADARAEFDEAFNWYAQRSVAAAIGFVSAVDVAIESILADPNRFVHTYAGCQVCRLKRYRYCVVYYQTDVTIHVVAIAHAKRRPGYWHNRI
ncbi:MAG: type II toxin-antitoxin system RelE/ParE family toxin, partial [Planctomycetota bacterium]